VNGPVGRAGRRVERPQGKCEVCGKTLSPGATRCWLDLYDDLLDEAAVDAAFDGMVAVFTEEER
jgi:hypothetical protein